MTVSQLNKRVKTLLEQDRALSEAFVTGEISNFKRHTTGHLYFTLKDENSSINCVMFSMSAKALKFNPENGLKALSWGHVSIYEKTGVYQLYVDFMEPFGKGAQALAFEQLKKKLEAEGLFDSARKRRLPAYPNCVAIITSRTGAAIRDIIQISQRRNPNVELVVAPALVQGADAPQDLMNALNMVNSWGKADVIIIGRGGGSQEDLNPFNDEALARAIAGSKTPVVSAVGHEIDFTIADFAADKRAPTPSAAAELVVPSLSNMKMALLASVNRMDLMMKRRSQEGMRQLKGLASRPVLRRPLEDIYNKQGYVADLGAKLAKEAGSLAERKSGEHRRLSGLLVSMSPSRTMERGYAIITDSKGQPVMSIKGVKSYDKLDVLLSDGKVVAQALSTIPRT
jgi:exodeoxyribonuclease VII large subunit